MTPLHVLGDRLRDAFAGIPLIAARLLFVALPLVLLCWVLTLPRSAVVREDGGGGSIENLRWWAALALVIQVLIYALI